MIEYTKHQGNNSTVYKKGNLFIKPDKIPAEVMGYFEHTDKVEYDDKPGEPRCLFCEAPRTHQRTINVVAHAVELKTVDLCDFHYYNQSLGSLVAKYRLIQQEKTDGESKVSKRSLTKGNKSKVTARLNQG